MMKQLFISIAILLGFASQSVAQSYVGSWELYPNYGEPSSVIETPDYVYTLAGTSLCGYDKATDEVIALNSANRLNGNKVTNIWYDPESKYLFVVYEDYDIDLVFDDGRVVNVPDLRDAAITASKTVNDVGFANGKAFVGTDSGMLIVDASHGAIVESCLWGKQITRIAATTRNIVLWVGWYADNEMYYASQTGSHHNFDASFQKVKYGFYPSTGLSRLGADKVLATHVSAAYVFDFSGSTITRSTLMTGKTIALGNTQPTRNGLMIAMGATLAYVAADGTVTEKTVAAANGQKAADWSGTGATVWLADAAGYGRYDTAASAYTISKAKPRGTSGSNVGRIIQHPLTGNFYISTAVQGYAYSLAYLQKTYVDVLNPTNKTFNAVSQSLLRTSLSGFDICPTNPDYILTGYHADGGRRCDISENKYISYNTASTVFPTNGSYTTMVQDKSGNLWICQKTGEIINIGKALKGSWETAANKAKWSYFTVPSITCNHSSRMIVDEANGIVIVTGGNGIAAIQMPASDAPLTANTKYVYNDCSVDEDGSTLGSWTIEAIAMDKSGSIWFGYDKGVFVVNDSKRLFDPGYAPARIKVPRNDGTNLADYLLDQIEIASIAVDENNQKWIGTIGSGLYRVSADGTEIIEHFTTDNCEIPSNEVLAVCPDSNSNDIYVGTPEGLAVYHSTTSPAAEDYKNVYAYPNPVTPDYTGYITIAGLKADSLVKIADASGNPVYETRSDGGMAVWNGCDSSGRRVRSGIYFVFASETGEGAGEAAVTKIVVVN